MPALDFSIRLRIERRRPDVCHTRNTNELFEVLGDELRTVVGNDPRLGIRVELPGFLQDDLDLGFRHRCPQIPMDQHPAIAVQNAAQIVKRAADIEVGDIDVPMLVRGQRLFEPRTFFRGLALPLR